MENFILEYQIPISELYVCDELIKYFHNENTIKREGKSGGIVQNEKKASTDASIYLNTKEFLPYAKHLEAAFKTYKSKYPSYPKNTVPHNSINIQYYKPGEGFKIWHHDRDNGGLTSVGRNLVL